MYNIQIYLTENIIAAAVIVVAISLLIVAWMRWKHKNGISIDSVLTMELLTKIATRYLQIHPDIEAIAVVEYKPDNVPSQVSDVIRGKLPASVHHIVIVAEVQDNVLKKVFLVRFANALDPALELSLKGGVLKIER